MISSVSKGEYFEKMVGGKLKLFRKRLVPVNDMNEFGKESNYVFESLLEEELLNSRNDSNKKLQESHIDGKYGPVFQRDNDDNSAKPSLYVPSGVQIIHDTLGKETLIGDKSEKKLESKDQKHTEKA